MHGRILLIKKDGIFEVKKIAWVLGIIILIVLIINIITTPVTWIGILITLYGLFQLRQQKRGKVSSIKPKWIVTSGIIISVILGIAFSEPNETALTEEKVASEEADAEKATAEKEKAEQKEKEEAARKAKEELEAARLKAEEEAAQKAAAEAEVAKKEEEKQMNVETLGLVVATVSRVVDGDTIELSDGSKVRLIGVNTPESTTRTEEYGKEASNYTKSILEGKSVWLQKDVSEADRYGRLLRIVWLDIPTNDMDENEIRTKMFNAHLVLNGYAEPSTYNPDVKYSEYFVKYAREAREANSGLWAYGENGTTKGDLDPTTTASSNSSSGDTSNSSNTNDGSSNSTSSSGTSEFFQNCTELRTKYPNGVPSDHPAYQSKMDRDKDNYACER